MKHITIISGLSFSLLILNAFGMEPKPDKLALLKAIKAENVQLVGLEGYESRVQAGIRRQLPQMLLSLQSVDDAVTIDSSDPDQVTAIIDLSKIVSFPLKTSVLGYVHSFLTTQPEDIRLVEGDQPIFSDKANQKKVVQVVIDALRSLKETEDGFLAIDVTTLPGLAKEPNAQNARMQTPAKPSLWQILTDPVTLSAAGTVALVTWFAAKKFGAPSE